MDDETKLTLHGLQQYYVKLKDNEKNRKLFDLLDALEFNQVIYLFTFIICVGNCAIGRVYFLFPQKIYWFFIDLYYWRLLQTILCLEVLQR